MKFNIVHNQAVIGNNFYCNTKTEIVKFTFNEQKTKLKISARRKVENMEVTNGSGSRKSVVTSFRSKSFSSFKREISRNSIFDGIDNIDVFFELQV